MKVFGDYARYYDLLYQDKDYQGEANYICSLIDRFALGGSSVLELGCGTAKHALLLAEKGLTIHCVDMSSDMLAIAEQQAAISRDEIANRLSFAQGDVRIYRCDRLFDVAISLFHVMSYQITNEDLQAVFTTAAKNLNPGGIFIFDYWYGPSVLTQKPDIRIKRLEDDCIKVQRIAEPVMFPNENRVQVNYSVLIENKKSHKLQRIKEQHDMRYLFLPEIEKLCQPEFDLLQHYGWMNEECPNFDDWAALSILRKKV